MVTALQNQIATIVAGADLSQFPKLKLHVQQLLLCKQRQSSTCSHFI